MAKANPGLVKADFLKRLDEIESILEISFTSSTRFPQKQRNRIAEFVFLGSAVLLEGFISDVIVAYINKAPAQFASYLVRNLSVSAEDEYSKRAIPHISTALSGQLTVAEIKKIIDPKDYNITFKNTDELKEMTGQWLDDPYRGYFVSLSKGSCALLAFSDAIRNFLAHRSPSARERIQSALVDTDLLTDFQRGGHQIHDVGSFLTSTVTPGSRERIRLFVAALRRLANILVP